MRPRYGASFTLALAALSLSTAAAASPEYPEAMQTELGLTKAPGCELCHRAAVEPVGAADTAFGKSMVARGLLGAADTVSLAKALDGLKEGGVDSDGDGARDLDELSWGGDPNHADVPEGGNEAPVTYGCSWAKGEREGGWGGVVVAVLGALVVRRGRGRSRRSR
jgi:cytochrome c551/c552